MTVGERIRALREARGLSQEELANVLGLKDKSSVCKIEKSGDSISTKSIKKYSEVLNVPIPYIMGWTDNKSFTQELYSIHKENLSACDLSSTERSIIQAYRNASEDTQIAVCAVLGVKKDTVSETEQSSAG